jgi:hypothetical protein
LHCLAAVATHAARTDAYVAGLGKPNSAFSRLRGESCSELGRRADPVSSDAQSELTRADVCGESAGGNREEHAGGNWIEAHFPCA